MKRDEASSLPDALRERLAQEPPAERAELEQVWRLMGEAPLEDVPPADTAWTAIQARTRPRPVTDRPARPAAHRRNRTRWLALAASVLALLLTGVIYWAQPVTVVAGPGEYVTATLPDGSVVELNSGTTLSYPRRFSRWPFVPAPRRVVHLTGEAYFDVQPGPRPFVVETFNARVEVLGTRFNVQARPRQGAGATQVTLAEGRVRVVAAQHPAQSTVLMQSGQTSRVTKATAPPTRPHPVSLEQALAWRHQGFAVTNWPLAAVFAELERRYNTVLTVRAPAVRADSMTLYYPRPVSLETILHDIAVVKGLSYRTTSRGYEIVPQ